MENEHPPCAVCHGEYAYPSDHAHGIMPDRELHPDLFICWECVHWLFKVFMDHITNFSYCLLFVGASDDALPKIGKLSNRVIRNEKIVPELDAR